MRWESALSLGQSNPEARADAGESSSGAPSIDPTPIDGSWTCEAAVQVEDLVEVIASGKVGKADPTGHPERTIVGFVTEKADSVNCTVRYSGEITLSQGLTAGADYFAADGGQVSSTPTSAKKLQKVGTAKTGSVLIIAIERGVLLNG